jgi:molecular chaperone DnaK
VVESVDPAGTSMTLALVAMDDAGRELVAWMGGTPPRALREEAAPKVSASSAAPAAHDAQDAVPGQQDQLEPDWPDFSDATPPLRVDGGEPTAATPPTPAVPAAPPPAAPRAAAPPMAPRPPAPAAPPPSPVTPAVRPPAAPPPVEAPQRAAAPSSAAPTYPPPSLRPSAPIPTQTLVPGAAPAPPRPAVVEDEPPAPRPRSSKKGRIVGIDLGTTNSAAAVVKDGKPFIIPSREGYNTIPSVVAVNEKGKVIVGHPAKGQLLINPRNTVHGSKRLIGRAFKSPVIADLMGRFSYEIVAGRRGEAAVKLGDNIFSLQKIASLVLTELKELAQQWLGEEVSRAVITVPAYYNDNQRQAVRAAGALAGLEVERILNEPTAAAIAFAHGRALQERVLVYDLGGGTFDTSVLQLQGSLYEVVSTGGDTFLGGVDFDAALVAEMLARFKRKHGIEFSGDRVAYQRITDAAERAKMALSERLTADVAVPFVLLVGDKPYSIEEKVSRSELDKLTEHLIDRTLRVCQDVLDNCGFKPSDISEVLLVGGQSRMPQVRSKIRDFFGREPSKTVHPDEAVALGAALLADSIQSGEIGGMVLVDVLPMSIGIALPGGRFKKIIERNTSLPHRKTHSIWTSEDQQKTLEIPVFQGESDRAQDNEYLGTLIVPDLPPGTKGNVVFDLVFSVSAESILTVTAEERGTARTVTATFSTQDTPETVRRRVGGGAVPAQPPQADGGKGKPRGWVKRLFGE